MLTVLWSVKGGVGVSVTSAMLAISAAHTDPCLLVDLQGDQPAILGTAEPTGPTLREWIASPTDVGIDSLRRVEHPVHDSLGLLLAGSSDDPMPIHEAPNDRVLVAARLLAQSGRSVIVDLGTGANPGSGLTTGFARALLAVADHSLLVTNACYLALRRASDHSVLPTGVVLVHQPERALRSSDVTAALGVPIVCTVPHSTAVARVVDAGLLTSRLPGMVRRPLHRYLRGQQQ